MPSIAIRAIRRRAISAPVNLAAPKLTHFRPQVGDIHSFHAIPSYARPPVSIERMRLIHRIRALVTGAVLVAGMVLTSGSAWSAPLERVPPPTTPPAALSSDRVGLDPFDSRASASTRAQPEWS